MYQLIITEKPSVAQTYAAAIGAKQRNDGYLEGNGYHDRAHVLAPHQLPQRGKAAAFVLLLPLALKS